MKVGRFQVMAILQAARAMELGFSETRAKSWGLNRAIFYAAAKRGFKHTTQRPGREHFGKKISAKMSEAFLEMKWVILRGRETEHISRWVDSCRLKLISNVRLRADSETRFHVLGRNP